MAPAICVVGAGHWSTSAHLPALKRVQEAGLADYAGVCDLNEDRSKPYAAELNAGAYTDFDKMIREVKPDGLTLVVGCRDMPGMILKAIEHGIPFLCEKPPATDAGTHIRLLDAAGDLVHAVGYNRRHAPYVTRAKEWLAGEVLQTVTAHFIRHRRREADFTTTSVHAIDTVLYLAGELESARLEIAPTGHVCNSFISGWTREGVRVDVTITPDTGSAQEHYIARSTEKTVRVAFPQRPMIDYPGYVELHEKNQVTRRLTCTDFGLAEDDLPGLTGVLAEEELFARMLTGNAEPRSTLRTSLQTQQLRELLACSPTGRTQIEWPTT